MNLEYIDSLYKTIFNEQIGTFILFSKVLAGLIIVITTSHDLFKSFSKTGQIFTDKEFDGFSPYKLGRALFLLLLISISTEILSLFDTIMVDIETIALSDIDERRSDITISHLPPLESVIDDVSGAVSDFKGDGNWVKKMWLAITKVARALNPLTWIGGSLAYALEFVLMIVDVFIYPFFLTKRYFLLGLIKLFFPLMIALSIFDKLQDYIINILKMYARVFLAIIPMIFCIYVVDMLRFNIQEILNTSTGGNATMAVAGPLVSIVSIVVSVLLKVRLFKESFTVMEKIIP